MSGWTVRVRVSVMCRVLGSKASAGVFARHAANKLPLSSGSWGDCVVSTPRRLGKRDLRLWSVTSSPCVLRMRVPCSSMLQPRRAGPGTMHYTTILLSLPSFNTQTASQKSHLFPSDVRRGLSSQPEEAPPRSGRNYDCTCCAQSAGQLAPLAGGEAAPWHSHRAQDECSRSLPTHQSAVRRRFRCGH